MINIRTIIISDCHGRPELITNALEHSKFDKNVDRLVFAGDIVDIGYQEQQCLDILIENKAEILYGNHDAAMFLGDRIWPQQWHDDIFKENLFKIMKNSKIAIVIDNSVLVTHAGYSNSLHKDLFKEEDVDIQNIVRVINRFPLRLVYEWKDGPLWYRPTKDNIWYNKCSQVCGHTPPGYVESMISPLKFDNFYMVDPYCENNFNSPNRYRYAEIINGRTKVFDSNKIGDLI